MNSSSSISFAATLSRAAECRDAFLALMDRVPYDNEGIPMSEMFFLTCALGDPPPTRVLESGRGGGQSTLMLAHLYPQAQVISLEENDRSPNAAIALARLAPFPQVECRFGDSRTLLPALLEPGDPVLIDGPKEFRALKLAFQLLRTGRPRAVFVHDLHVDSPARAFLDRHWPAAFFSDEPQWVESHADLDRQQDHQPKAHWLKVGRRGYGPTLACLPGNSDADLGALLRRMTLARVISHARDKIGLRGALPPAVG